jgi:DNA-binding transcriptional ArsR family regulator
MSSSNFAATGLHILPSSPAQPDIDYSNVLKTAKILRALNHKLRQQILITIYNHPRISVTDIYVKLRLEQSVASQHLAILRNAGILSIERKGKFIFYSLNHERIEKINHYTKNLIENR